jgi:DNA-binding Xre family transcriptional regulator
VLTKSQLRKLRQAKPGGPNRVKLAIQLAETTQVRVAASVGHTQAYISSIANGEYSAIPLETTRALARHFGCSIEDLFPAREAVA